MSVAKLNTKVWEYDESVALGPPGGFGTVFLGRSETGEEVAVKRLHLAAASTGNRELVITEELVGKPLLHVIPFYDSGIDAETTQYFIVMAKAEKSLQDLINTGAVLEVDAVQILKEIANGLRDVDEIVHRDLKPGNVLLHEGKWKLADFGIARFVENSTSLNTLKDCLSPLYAAPEQWRFERATKATDVYAFGCIAYALLTGQPPFPSGDLRARHLFEDPPKLVASMAMQQLVSLCLRKSPGARPSIDSIIKQLQVIGGNAGSHAGLAAAGAAIAVEEAKKEAELSRKQTEDEKRAELAADALSSLRFITDELFDRIQQSAQLAKRVGGAIQLGTGTLEIRECFRRISKDAFSNSGKDIICGAFIGVEQKSTHYIGRSANLWFGEFSPGEYRWHEVPYMALSTATRHDPFGFSDERSLKDADLADAPIMHIFQVAATPKPIDREMVDEFLERWMSRLAEASMNRLQRPYQLPEP